MRSITIRASPLSRDCQNRPSKPCYRLVRPKTAGELILSIPKSPVSIVVRQFLWVFIALSFVGLVLSVWVHFGAVMGRHVAPEPSFWLLHIGIFVVWIPAVLVAKERVGNPNRKDFWKVCLGDLPDWVLYLLYGFFGYAFIYFTYFFIEAPTGPSTGDTPAIVWRWFSGHWMLFYFAALVILYSAAKKNLGTQCLNGHQVPPYASLCAQCGQAVTHRR